MQNTYLKYKYGFSDLEEHVVKFKKVLNEEVIRISKLKRTKMDVKKKEGLSKNSFFLLKMPTWGLIFKN